MTTPALSQRRVIRRYAKGVGSLLAHETEKPPRGGLSEIRSSGLVRRLQRQRSSCSSRDKQRSRGQRSSAKLLFGESHAAGTVSLPSAGPF